ncbi:MAG: hypothetical protein DMF62_00280 [Acidobacteria bacterium]|nr:MAG: hypothetical protein DMF62_00280 [Acidobacteriota bacterium]
MENARGSVDANSPADVAISTTWPFKIEVERSACDRLVSDLATIAVSKVPKLQMQFSSTLGRPLSTVGVSVFGDSCDAP